MGVGVGFICVERQLDEAGEVASTGTAPAGATGGKGGSTTVVPAASTGSIDPSKLPAGSRPHGHGTIAVFTMTGN